MSHIILFLCRHYLDMANVKYKSWTAKSKNVTNKMFFCNTWRMPVKSGSLKAKYKDMRGGQKLGMVLHLADISFVTEFYFPWQEFKEKFRASIHITKN